MDRADHSATTQAPSFRTEWPSLLVLALWFIGAAMAIGVRWEVPIIDDWTYAWSVERLLTEGRLEVLDWSAVFPLGHALWGAAWSLALGFSFATLRLSTIAFALVGSSALYFLLRELGTPRRIALLGALTVAVNPAVLLLSFSFMTDVPFVSLTLLALLCYVRAMRRHEAHLVWWGGVWAYAAFLDRQIAILTPLAALPLLFAGTNVPRMKRSTMVIALAATWGAMLVTSLVMISFVRPTGEMTKLVDRLSYILQVPVTSYFRYNLYIFSTVAFYALPALLGMATVRGLWRTRMLLLTALFVGATMLVSIGEVPVPLRRGNTWTMIEVGGSRGLLNGRLPSTGSTAIEFVLRGVGLLAAALALLSLTRRDRILPATIPVPRTLGALTRRVIAQIKTVPITTRTPLVVYLAAYLLLANVLWMYNDRYLLVLLPIVAALALGGQTAPTGVPRLAYCAAVIFALVAVAGTRDALRFNQSVRDSWQSLVDSGIQPTDIDAGYTWTGWVLYAHPKRFASGLTVQDVPWITSKRRALYVFSQSPLAGYDITREVAWTDDAPWPGPDRMLVLKRHAPN